MSETADVLRLAADEREALERAACVLGNPANAAAWAEARRIGAAKSDAYQRGNRAVGVLIGGRVSERGFNLGRLAADRRYRSPYFQQRDLIDHACYFRRRGQPLAVVSHLYGFIKGPQRIDLDGVEARMLSAPSWWNPGGCRAFLIMRTGASEWDAVKELLR